MGHNVSFLGFAVQNCRGYCKKIKHRQPLKSKIKHTVMRCSCFMCFSTVGQCVTVNSIIMEIRIRNRKKKISCFIRRGWKLWQIKHKVCMRVWLKKKNTLLLLTCSITSHHSESESAQMETTMCQSCYRLWNEDTPHTTTCVLYICLPQGGCLLIEF